LRTAARLRKSLSEVLPAQLRQYLRNQLSLVRVPERPRTLISDLFPFRVDSGWETHFELLNVPLLIDPARDHSSTYPVNFIFFDEDGSLLLRWNTENSGCHRRTISINGIVGDLSKTGRGTFACFHNVFLPQLEARQGFLAERGYTGYANAVQSTVKGYVHGNLDAIALDDNDRLTCLGKSFRIRTGEYRLQHQLEGPATYEMCVVNTSDASEEVSFEVTSSGPASTKVSRVVPSRGTMWLSRTVGADERARVVIRSKLNLPRPVVFRVESESFDVFHG
jgi:hypothetical protein